MEYIFTEEIVKSSFSLYFSTLLPVGLVNAETLTPISINLFHFLVHFNKHFSLKDIMFFGYLCFATHIPHSIRKLRSTSHRLFYNFVINQKVKAITFSFIHPFLVSPHVVYLHTFGCWIAAGVCSWHICILDSCVG